MNLSVSVEELNSKIGQFKIRLPPKCENICLIADLRLSAKRGSNVDSFHKYFTVDQHEVRRVFDEN